MSDDAVPTFVGISLLLTDEGREALEKAVTEAVNEMFEEKTVVIQCPYAEAVEYGTTPSKGEQNNQMATDEETGERISLTKLKFREWIGLKDGIHGKERAKKGDAIYKHVMEEGAKPHPYIRPAIRDLEMTDFDDIMNLTDADNIADACIQFLAMRMVYYLEKNKSVATGELKKSIMVVPKVMAQNVHDFDNTETKYNWKPGQARE